MSALEREAQVISRRRFLGLSGSALLLSQMTWAKEGFPPVLDHILLGCSDLDQGIALVEQHTGVRAAVGGVHPGRGTRNALLSLGELHYLEIIAPDPAQSGVSAERVNELRRLKAPQLVGWAAHANDIDGLAKRLRSSGISVDGPLPGSRKRPDGRMLIWKTLNVPDDRHGLIPFFIEWSGESVHPSVDAPKGCTLESFAATDPDPSDLSRVFGRLELEVPVEKGSKAELRARIAGPTRKLELTS
jgi:hypothetical protein